MRIGAISTMRDHGTGISSDTNDLSDPSINQNFAATSAPDAMIAPITPTNMASRTNGDWMNQLDATTSFIPASSLRRLYAATLMVLPTSSNAAAPWITATPCESVCVEPSTP